VVNYQFFLTDVMFDIGKAEEQKELDEMKQAVSLCTIANATGDAKKTFDALLAKLVDDFPGVKDLNGHLAAKADGKKSVGALLKAGSCTPLTANPLLTGWLKICAGTAANPGAASAFTAFVEKLNTLSAVTRTTKASEFADMLGVGGIEAAAAGGTETLGVDNDVAVNAAKALATDAMAFVTYLKDSFKNIPPDLKAIGDAAVEAELVKDDSDMKKKADELANVDTAIAEARAGIVDNAKEFSAKDAAPAQTP
jgi:hypothetical protein